MELLKVIEAEIPLHWEETVGESLTLHGWLVGLLDQYGWNGQAEGVAVDHDEYGDAVSVLAGDYSLMVAASPAENPVFAAVLFDHKGEDKTRISRVYQVNGSWKLDRLDDVWARKRLPVKQPKGWWASLRRWLEVKRRH